jgi:DNA-directed RNA polymerase specialized sigma24 family protein
MYKAVEDFIAEAVEENKKETALNLIQIGDMTLEAIAKSTGLPLAEVKKTARSDTSVSLM